MLARFPTMPQNPFWQSDAQGARAALAAIGVWRDAWIGWLGGPERDAGISPALAESILEFLAAPGVAAPRRRPYRLGPFPLSALRDSPDPSAALREALLWRAGLVDFLSDVWDTMGEAEFGIEECGRIAALLSADGDVCSLCLSPMDPDRKKQAKHFDACAVQIAWRSQSS